MVSLKELHKLKQANFKMIVCSYELLTLLYIKMKKFKNKQQQQKLFFYCDILAIIFWILI